MAKKANTKPNRKKCKGLGYRDYESKRKASGKGTEIKFKLVQRMVRRFIKKKNSEYCELESC